MEFREALALEIKLITGTVTGILQGDVHVLCDEEVKRTVISSKTSYAWGSV